MDTNYAARGGRAQPTADAGFSCATARVLQAGFVLALALQVYVLYLYTPGPSVTVSIPHADTVVHAVVFAVPAAAGVLARLRPWLVGLVLAVHAPVSELVQHLWLPARSGELGDILADWAGVALGLALGSSVLARWLSHRGQAARTTVTIDRE